MRYIGQLWSGYNLIHYIGPLLGTFAVLLILRKAYFSSTNSLQQFLDFAFFSFCSYLLLATTVHPWYLVIPIMLSVFVRFRFVVTWSFLIMLSLAVSALAYSAQSTSDGLLHIPITKDLSAKNNIVKGNRSVTYEAKICI